jgi:hypothetical protein
MSRRIVERGVAQGSIAPDTVAARRNA